MPVLIALLVCLIPTTIGGLLSAIGIAGMDRMIQQNVIAMSGRAVEAAGDVNTLLLDKTGTITLGNRQAVGVPPGRGRVGSSGSPIARSSRRSPTRRRKGAASSCSRRSSSACAVARSARRGPTAPRRTRSSFPSRATTRMSGVNMGALQLRKGAGDAVVRWVTREPAAAVPADLEPIVDKIARRAARRSSSPSADDGAARVLGVIYLKDVVKGGIRERFDRLRAMGIRTVMITGDNPLTAAAIAQEAGVDDFLAEATPEDKMTLIKREQAGGKLVAMTGDGTNDAPALAQADVGVAMNSGTQAAKEAGNMIDLDSNPTKLIEVVEIGKQLLMTRGALTTFSIANDVAKYFAIIPAMFVATYPALAGAQRHAAALAAVGDPRERDLQRADHRRAHSARAARRALSSGAGGVILRRNLLVYGVGGAPRAVRRHQADRRAARRHASRLLTS